MRANIRTPRILAVGIARAVFERLAPTLRRDAFDVDWIPTLESGLTLVTKKPFEIIILNAEPVGRPLGEVLQEIRVIDSTSRCAGIVVLAEPDEVDAARKFKGRGASSVMLVSDPPDVIYTQISVLLKVAPRAAVNLPIKIESGVENKGRELFCQTENLSMSGMLVRTRQPLQIGSTVTFTIHLSDSIGSLSGRGETVRHSTTPEGKVGGAGIRFLDFEADGDQLLHNYLKDRVPEKEFGSSNSPESLSERRIGDREKLASKVQLKLE